ncbi:MAG: hybrid sensor histidine kinase/response regulator, partial [Rhodobacteraceae bacterium]|nr:hybrid sensor histidine kinase/response regulator [Paracoccaceae bacterium]
MRRQGYAVLLTAAVLCIVAIISLAQAVSRDLTLLESANSDNVQWTLSQAEVEYLEFERELDHGIARGAPDLDQIRQEFDIFYSRIATLQNGALYQDLRQTRDFTEALTGIRAFLDRHVPLIDGLEAASEQELLVLQRETAELDSEVRKLANSGLFYFAKLSDERRKSIAISLQRLALVTTSLIAALALLAYYSHWMRHQAQRGKIELQKAYARVNTVVNASLDAVIVSDNQGRILDFNAAAERIFGYRLEDIRNQPLGDLLVPEHLREAHFNGVRRMNRNGEARVIGHGRLQLEAMRAGGEVFPCELALESAGRGEDRLIIGFLRDISAQVAAEQELVEARDRALAGEKAKSDFLAVMTHEIRTPLNGVIGNLSLLEDTQLTQRQGRYAHNMSISARQLMQHVDTVLDIARFEAGQIASTEAPTHLGHLLQDIVDGQSGHAEARGNTLQWGWLGQQMTWVQTDAAKLQQVLLNLVGNAIKFTRDGKVSLEAERVAPGQVEFRVIDTGIGIAQADQARVFEDFQTIDTSFQRQSSGTGLGLG